MAKSSVSDYIVSPSPLVSTSNSCNVHSRDRVLLLQSRLANRYINTSPAVGAEDPRSRQGKSTSDHRFHQTAKTRTESTGYEAFPAEIVKAAQ